jgi:hypothetical protein
LPPADDVHRGQGEINRPGAAGSDLIQLAQFTVAADAPRLHHSLFHFAGAVQGFAIRRDGKLGQVRQRPDQRFIAQRPGLAIDGKAIQPFAIGVVGADPGVLGLRSAPAASRESEATSR